MSGRLRNGYTNRGTNRATVILFTGTIVLLLLSAALTTAIVRRETTQQEGTATPVVPTTVAVVPTETPGASPGASAVASSAPPGPSALATASATVAVSPRPVSPTAAGTPATPSRPGSPVASAGASSSARPSGAPSGSAAPTSPRPSVVAGSPSPAASSVPPRATQPPPTAVMGGCGIVLPTGFAEERPGYFPATNRRGFIALDPFETNGGQRSPTEIAQQFISGTLQLALQDVRETATTRTDEGVRVEYTASAGGQPGRGVVVVRRVGEIACGVTYFVLSGTTTQFEQTLDAILASLQPVRIGKE